AHVADRAAGYGVPGVAVDGWDALAVYAATRAAAERARNGGGPTLIEARVARLSRHTSQVGEHRSAEELQALQPFDPLPHFERYLRDQGLLDDDRELALQAQAEAEVADAAAYAESIPPPAPEEAFDHLFATPI